MYRVLYNTGRSLYDATVRLEEQVERFSLEGYLLQGGVSIALENDSEDNKERKYIACQAMVKND